MKFFSATSLALLALASVAPAALAVKEIPTTLQIGVKHRPEKCEFQTQKGDKLSM